MPLLCKDKVFSHGKKIFNDLQKIRCYSFDPSCSLKDVNFLQEIMIYKN